MAKSYINPTTWSNLVNNVNALNIKLNKESLFSAWKRTTENNNETFEDFFNSINTSSGVPIEIPDNLTWDKQNYSFNIRLYDTQGFNKSVSSISITPEELFNKHSTAYSNPGATFYVDITSGNDSNNGLALNSAFRSIGKAITSANTAAVPTKIFVKSGSYHRTHNPAFNSTAAVNNLIPTVDIALIATNGRVLTGTFEDVNRLPAFTVDATHTNTYSSTATTTVGGTDGFDRVVDLLNTNDYGNYQELIYVSSASICNSTPGTWFSEIVGGQHKVYVNRSDRKAVTLTNTRFYRAGAFIYTLRQTNDCSLYIGGIDGESGFDFEGGGVLQANGMQGAPVLYNNLNPSNTRRAFIASNCSFKYGGGKVNTGSVGVGVDNLNGIAAFFNCTSDANQTDGFNFHTHLSTFYSSGKRMYVLTVNCSATDNGRDSNLSCQGLTTHNSVISIDASGYYSSNRGGNVRNIDDSYSMLIGTFSENDKGYTGFYPAGIQIDNNAKMWADRVKVNMPSASYAFRVTNGTVLYRRNCWPTRQPDAGSGQFINY